MSPKALIPLLLISLGCNTANRGPASIIRDAELEPYITAFEQEFGLNYGGSAYFEPLTAPTVGHCQWWTNGDAIIRIDPADWQTFNANQREVLMLHELGHCSILRLGHNNNRLDNGMPESIMRSYIFNLNEARFFGDNKRYYYDELGHIVH